MEYTVTISMEEYRELLDKSTRIKVLESMINTSNYFSKTDIFEILGIEEKEDE